MRNEQLFRTFSAICLTLVLALGFTVPTSVQDAAPPPAEGITNDNNMVVEETGKVPLLTPGGNATSVDDFGSNKQPITVITKTGNYFHTLIDGANEDKKTAIHSLNQADEAGLMALMEDGSAKEKPPTVCSCMKKCEAGAVSTARPVRITDKSERTGKAPRLLTEALEPEKEKPAGLNLATLTLLLALLGGGGVFTYLKFVKNKSKAKGSGSPDDYDYGEEDSEERETEDEEVLEDGFEGSDPNEEHDRADRTI